MNTNTPNPKAPCPLAVMDAAEAVMLTEHTFSRAVEMREARAKVAELVAAAAHLRETRTYKGTADVEARRARLDAALAAFSEVQP